MKRRKPFSVKVTYSANDPQQLTPEVERLWAKVFASLGGKSKSKKKAAAARRNGRKGGRPRKVQP